MLWLEGGGKARKATSEQRLEAGERASRWEAGVLTQRAGQVTCRREGGERRAPAAGLARPRSALVGAGWSSYGRLWGSGPGGGGCRSVTQGWAEGISHTLHFSTTSVCGNGVEWSDLGSGFLVALVTRSQPW